MLSNILEVVVLVCCLLRLLLMYSRVLKIVVNCCSVDGIIDSSHVGQYFIYLQNLFSGYQRIGDVQ